MFHKFYQSIMIISLFSVNIGCEKEKESLPLYLRFTAPSAESLVGGDILLQFASSEEDSIRLVRFEIDGKELITLRDKPWRTRWDSRGANNGKTLIRAVVIDSNEGTHQIEERIIVHNPGKEGDEKPQLTLLYPGHEAALCGTLSLEAQAEDDHGIAEVEFFVDDRSVGTVTQRPFRFAWNTMPLAERAYRLRAVARDTLGQKAQDQTVAKVKQQVPCDNPPNVLLPPTLAPERPLHRTVEIYPLIADDEGVSKVQILLDHALIAESSAAPFLAKLDTTLFEDGVHTLKAFAYDLRGQRVAAQQQVLIDNASPVVNVSLPREDLQMQEGDRIKIDAHDNLSVSRIEVKLEDKVVATLTRPPYHYTWTAADAPCGDSTLSVTAIDQAGNRSRAETSYRLRFLPQNYCRIDGRCYEGGRLNEKNPCFICDPTKSTDGWTDVSEGSSACMVTFAGSGQRGAKDGPAPRAQFDLPSDIAVDGEGRVYVADQNGIRLIVDQQVKTLPGIIDPATLTAEEKEGLLMMLAVDHAGVLYYSHPHRNQIWTYSQGKAKLLAGSGQHGYADGPALQATFGFPRGLAVDAEGRVYVADVHSNRIRMIYRGQVTTFAGNGTSATADGTVLEAGFFWPLDVALDGAGKLYVVSEGLSKLRMIERGYVRTLDVDVYPQEVSTDPMGNLFIVDSPRDRVSLVKENKALPIIDGFVEQWRNGPLAKAMPGAIGGMAVDGKGRIYLVDGQNHVIRLIVR